MWNNLLVRKILCSSSPSLKTRTDAAGSIQRQSREMEVKTEKKNNGPGRDKHSEHNLRTPGEFPSVSCSLNCPPCLLPTLKAPHYEIHLGALLTVPNLVCSLTVHIMLWYPPRRVKRNLLKICTTAHKGFFWKLAVIQYSLIPVGEVYSMLGRVWTNSVAQNKQYFFPQSIPTYWIWNFGIENYSTSKLAEKSETSKR